MVVPRVSSGRATWKARDIAVAIVAQGVHNALARNDPDQLWTANDGEILLQGVDAADEGVGEGIRGRERGEIGEHDFTHLHCVDHGLKEDTLVFNLRADHDEKAGDDEPVIVEQHTGDHGGEGQDLAEAGGGTAGGRKAVLAGEAAADEAAHVERIGGDEMQDGEAGLHPHHAAEQKRGGDEGLAKEVDIAPGTQECGGQHEGRGGVGHRTGERDGKLAGTLVSFLLAFGIRVGKQSADGQKENGAQAEAKPGCHQQPCCFPDDDCCREHEKQANAAQCAVVCAEHQAHDRQQREKGVDAELNSHPSAQGD